MDPVFRAPMRARGHDALPGVGADHGVAHGVVGIGDTAEARISRFAEVSNGAFVWTRDTDGMYWVGRIAGPLRPAGPTAREVAGLTHVRAADWLDRPFGEHDVPVAVAATFARGGRNFQRTHGDAVERRTAEIWLTAGPNEPGAAS
jgi:hypothetical protein